MLKISWDVDNWRTSRSLIHVSWSSLLTVTASLGFLVIAGAMRLAVYAHSEATLIFWIGLVVIFVPSVIRLFSTKPSRTERIVLVLVVGLLFYGVKVLRSPSYFTFYDELLHTRTLDDLLKHGLLFTENPLFPISSLYPGLEIIADALASLTHQSIFVAGSIVILVARVVLMLALYLLYETISNSPRIAGVATLIYAANPSFLYLDGQFAYESLALPLLVMTLYLLAWRERSDPLSAARLTPMIVLLSATIIVTHHITSFVLLGLLIVLNLITLIAQLFSRTLDNGLSEHGSNIQLIPKTQPNTAWRWRSNVLFVSAVFIGIVAWTATIATPTIGYLAPTFVGAVKEIFSLISGEYARRTLFVASNGVVAPLEERLFGLIATGLVVLALPFGLMCIFKRYLQNVSLLALTIAAIAYPVTLIFRFTSVGADISGRSWEFLYLGIAVVIGIGLVDFLCTRWPGYISKLALVIGATIILIGNIITGWSPTERLPGPYQVSAQGRSIDIQSVLAAQWVHNYLNPVNCITADRMNGLLLGSASPQCILLRPPLKIDFASLYFSETVDSELQTLIADSGLHYLFIDLRLSTALPVRGTYFDYTEPNAMEHKTPISITALQKYASISDAFRIFDSGSITIYEISRLPDGTSR